MLFRLKGAFLALLLATALVPQAPQPAHAFFGLCFWWCPPSAASLIEQRPNLKKQPQSVKDVIRHTVDSFRANGGTEDDVRVILDEFDTFVSRKLGAIQGGYIWHVGNTERIGQAAARVCATSLPTAIICAAGVIVGGIVYSSSTDSTKQKTLNDIWSKHSQSTPMGGDPCDVDAAECDGIWSGGGDRGQFLRNKLGHVKNEIAAGGNRGITGSVTEKEAYILGRQYVGQGYRVTHVNGQRIYISRDGLRQFRGPSQKSGINPNTNQPYSRTGWQVNFESRATASGKWENNVHLDVAGMK